MIQRDDLRGRWIEAGDVWSLVVITGVTGQREIVILSLSMMLDRNDMVDLKRQWVGRLRNLAVLALALRA